MSKVRADSYVDRLGTGAPTFTAGLNVTGVLTATSAIVGAGATINNGGVNITGVVTATSFKGDGSLLTGLVAGVGIQTAGGTVGTGATFLDFRGSGISTVTVGSGIATVNIAGGGGGFSAVGYVFSL